MEHRCREWVPSPWMPLEIIRIWLKNCPFDSRLKDSLVCSDSRGGRPFLPVNDTHDLVSRSLPSTSQYIKSLPYEGLPCITYKYVGHIARLLPTSMHTQQPWLSASLTSRTTLDTSKFSSPKPPDRDFSSPETPEGDFPPSGAEAAAIPDEPWWRWWRWWWCWWCLPLVYKMDISNTNSLHIKKWTRQKHKYKNDKKHP